MKKCIVTYCGKNSKGNYSLGLDVPNDELFFGEVTYKRVFINFGKKDITANKAFTLDKEIEVPLSML